MAPEVAWGWPEIELLPPHFHAGVILDVDHAHAYHALLGLELDGLLPVHSWVVECQDTGHAHAAWLYRDPVYSGPKAKPNPIRVHTRLSEWLSARTDADRAYAETLTHNPMRRAQNRSERAYKTYWGLRGGHSLKYMRAFIPKGWRVPRMPRTVSGRRSQLYRVAQKWAGSPHRIGVDVLPQVEWLNQQFDEPLPSSDVRSIAKSIEKSRANRWTYYTQEEILEWHRKGGKARVKQRRAQNAHRDADIVALHALGESQRTIAKRYGIAHTTVGRVLERQAGR